MSSRCIVPAPIPAIRHVLSEYIESRSATLEESELLAYRRILFFLELCINNYGHRNLTEDERALCERHYRAAAGSERHFFEVFGPDKLLPELDFFAEVYVRRDVFTSERIEKKAPLVVDDLRLWLVERGYVDRADVETSKTLARKRGKLERQARQAARLLAQDAVRVDPLFFTDRDYIDTDDHPISRVAPGRFWLRVYRNTEPEDIGPLLAPEAATRSLRVGWNLSCALARVQGRWRIAGVDEIYPNLAATPLARARADGYNRGPDFEGGDR